MNLFTCLLICTACAFTSGLGLGAIIVHRIYKKESK